MHLGWMASIHVKPAMLQVLSVHADRFAWQAQGYCEPIAHQLSKVCSAARKQACFSPEWASLVEASFRNFLAEVIQQLPLPAVLRFAADRERRAALQAQCTQLVKENVLLRKVRSLAACGRSQSQPSSLHARCQPADFPYSLAWPMRLCSSRFTRPRGKVEGSAQKQGDAGSAVAGAAGATARGQRPCWEVELGAGGPRH